MPCAVILPTPKVSDTSHLSVFSDTHLCSLNPWAQHVPRCRPVPSTPSLPSKLHLQHRVLQRHRAHPPHACLFSSHSSYFCSPSLLRASRLPAPAAAIIRLGHVNHQSTTDCDVESDTLCDAGHSQQEQRTGLRVDLQTELRIMVYPLLPPHLGGQQPARSASDTSTTRKQAIVKPAMSRHPYLSRIAGIWA